MCAIHNVLCTHYTVLLPFYKPIKIQHWDRAYEISLNCENLLGFCCEIWHFQKVPVKCCFPYKLGWNLIKTTFLLPACSTEWSVRIKCTQRQPQARVRDCPGPSPLQHVGRSALLFHQQHTTRHYVDIGDGPWTQIIKPTDNCRQRAISTMRINAANRSILHQHSSSAELWIRVPLTQVYRLPLIITSQKTIIIWHDTTSRFTTIYCL